MEVGASVFVSSGINSVIIISGARSSGLPVELSVVDLVKVKREKKLKTALVFSRL